jgi:photosystem II stability/assembly factor-like uncharacterized protein
VEVVSVKLTRIWLPALLALLAISAAFPSGQASRFDESFFERLAWRNLGPFRAGGWTTDVAVPDAPVRSHLYTFYVGTRNGGVWKTTNNGTTFEPVFDKQAALSIGALAVAPSNGNIVWAGTGESYNARSSYSGNGIYKSADAGKTWTHMGLADTHHIARVLVDPKNPDIVYVAAMGHLFSTNDERGVFKTTDGGKTWQKSLFVNAATGAIDLVMNRRDPGTLYAATYEKVRTAWDFDSGGPGTGIYKTTDAGKSWTRLGGGLPAGRLGRIGLDIYQAKPATLYAIVENANLRKPTDAELAADKDRPRPPERVIGNEIYRTDDGGRTWRKTHDDKTVVGSKAAYSFNMIRIDPGNPNHILITSDTIPSSEDGGRTWLDTNWPPKRMFARGFGDVRNIWWDPQNPERIVMVSDGGLHISYDGGRTTDHYLNLPTDEFYAIDADMEDPYNVYGGLQDHDSWRGPSNGWSGSVTIADWITVGTGDGMYNRVDQTDSRWLYNTSQFGDHQRVDQKTRTRTNILPKRTKGQPPFRWNWNTPIVISPHNSMTIYTGAQVLLRSLDRGDTWQEISPDLTTNDAAKQFGRGNIQFCTITTISESPAAPGVIWIGTDDGRVQVTRNGGAAWTDVTEPIARAGGPSGRWVSRVFASSRDAGTAYVAKSGFRNDDFKPYLYRTTDFGGTWTSIAANLPDQPINVVVEDRKNGSLLFAGTDAGVFVSIDAGARWIWMRGNMPNVPVHDMLVHPRENDLIVGTYGRGIWIADVSVLQQVDEKVLGDDVHLFDIEPRTPFNDSGWGNYDLYGDRVHFTPNEPNAISVNYYLREKTDTKVTVKVSDLSGKLVRTLEGTSQKGLNTVQWNMRDDDRRGVPDGRYVVTLAVGARAMAKTAVIRPR